MSASLDEKLRGVEWGKYKLGDLFTFKGIKQAKSQRKIPTDRNGVHYIVQSMGNNMYDRNVNKQWLVDNNEAPVDGNAIVLGVTLPAVSYQPVEFGASQVITARADFLNERIGLFFVIILKKLCFNLFSYDKKPGISIYKNLVVELPTKDKKIDFDFMESFIAELETFHIAELEGYLSATGLKDYILTEEEEKALEIYPALNFKEYDILDIFSVKNTSNILSCDITENSGSIPYLCASSENNSVSSYIEYDENYLEEGNCIFIGGKTFVVSYQEHNFYSNDSHNLALYLNNQDARTKLHQLYLTTCVYKSLSHKYSWGDSVSKTKIKNDRISLPTKDGKPDFDIMQTFISAIQKLVIKDVVLYSENKMNMLQVIAK